jgi:hypothetical protein
VAVIRCRAAALPILLSFATGCLTPQMGRDIENALDLGPTRPVRRGEGSVSGWQTPLDRDQNLPARIWYVDPVTQIYHERRTNTFVLYDDAHKGWIAVSREVAFRDFRSDRARLLVQGPPPEIERVLDYIVSLEPSWRGL